MSKISSSDHDELETLKESGHFECLHGMANRFFADWSKRDPLLAEAIADWCEELGCTSIASNWRWQASNARRNMEE